MAKQEGISIVFCFANREYRADCYDLEDVASFIDDWSTDFTEDGQLTLRWYGKEGTSVPCTFYIEHCCKNVSFNPSDPSKDDVEYELRKMAVQKAGLVSDQEEIF